MTIRPAVRIAAISMAVILVAPNAAARVRVDDKLKDAYSGCVAQFKGTGVGLDILERLEQSNKDVRIRKPIFSGSSTTTALPGSDIQVNWDAKEDGVAAPSEGGQGFTIDHCAALIHELAHADDFNSGTDRDSTFCYVGGKYVSDIAGSEAHAVRVENEYRAEAGLPPRTSYSGQKIPPAGKDCDLPAPDKPRSPGCNVGAVGANYACATTNGDPHLLTFDGARYDFQAAGEFVLTRASSNDLEVQVRQTTFPGLPDVSINSGAAMNVSGDRVGIYSGPDGLTLRINGAETPPVASEMALPRGGKVTFRDQGLTVRWPDGATFDADPIGQWGIRIDVGVPAGRKGTLEGLLGVYDGDPANDVAVRDGDVLPLPAPFDTLYPKFADSWRITQENSLFDYAHGQTTASFTDRTKPSREITSDSVPNRTTAELICRRAGVTDSQVLANCTLDVGLTGQAAFADDAARSQKAIKSAGDTTLTVTQPDNTAQISVPGQAGQAVFVEVIGSDLPDQCNVVSLLNPEHRPVASGCIIGGTGFIDATVLPVPGKYALVLDPDGDAIGSATVRVTTVRDQHADIEVDGPPVIATIEKPGAVSSFTFRNDTGRKVFIEATESTLPDLCDFLLLKDAQNQFIKSGCAIGGKGFIDGTFLPAPGEYRLLVDPPGAITGTVKLRVSSALDQHKSVIIGGAPVIATIAHAGAVATLTFNAEAGRDITVEATDSDLPDECNVLTLQDPQQRTIGLGCVIDGTGSIDSTTLTETGEYTLHVDPAATTTGKVTIRIRE